MQNVRVAIVGAGLAGLYAAYVLEKKGIKDYVVLEARDVLGGRIASTIHSGGKSDVSGEGFDLGPAWFWPAFQTDMARLVDELELETFEQFETGDMLLERSSDQSPERTAGYVNSPPSMRIAGGMYALIDALYQQLDPARVVTGQTVRSLRIAEPNVELVSENARGQTLRYSAEHVLLAMPPRLVESQLTFCLLYLMNLRGSGRLQIPGWPLTQNILPCLIGLSGGRKGYPGRPEVRSGRWLRSTMPLLREGRRPCLVSWVCLLTCAVVFLRKSL